MAAGAVAGRAAAQIRPRARSAPWISFCIDEEKNVDDEPVIVRTGDLEHEFKVEIGFLELEVVAYSGALKIVGYAHFGHGGRTTSRAFVRPSAPHQRPQADAVEGEHLPARPAGELIETVPFVVINLDRVDVVYARDVPGDAEGAADERGAGRRG